jgi:hypothetical protein
MLHENRIWSVHIATDFGELARILSQYTCPCCRAYQVGVYLFANDALSEDGAQEFAVLRDVGDPVWFSQIESITFSWCSEEKALELIQRVCLGEFDSERYGRVARKQFQVQDVHRSCFLCA